MAKEIDKNTWLEHWPVAYYQETDAKKRKEILDYAIENKVDSEDNQLRQKLYDSRYSYSKDIDGMADGYMKAFMDMDYAYKNRTSRFLKKGIVKEFQKNLDKMGLTQLELYGEKIVYEELYQAACLYINLCKEDRNFGCILFGIGTIKKEDMAAKIAEVLYHFAYVAPKAFGFEDSCKLLRKAVTEAYYDQCPNFDEYLDRLIDEEA